MSWFSFNTGIELAEQGLLPDWAIRIGIRQLLARRTHWERQRNCEEQQVRLHAFLDELRSSPIAISTPIANQQHYEVPAEYFRLVLGPHAKYSCCLWSDLDRSPTAGTLETAEEEMLALTCERAGLRDGQSILELGCGWGSLSLFMADRYPNSQIVAISNSNSQRRAIEQQARERGLVNLTVITSDINDFDPAARLENFQRFDRVVSVEMFEHVRNYELLLARIADWLQPDGQLFVHIFCHRSDPYPFETEGDENWMGKHFFTGGIMPSDSLLSYFNHDLQIDGHWHVNGRHYSRTLEEWLLRHDACRPEILALFSQTYGEREGNRMFHRWRIFYLACSELFRWENGNCWYVSHYRLRPVGRRTRSQVANSGLSRLANDSVQSSEQACELAGLTAHS